MASSPSHRFYLQLSVDFRGEQRSNETHESTSNPDALLLLQFFRDAEIVGSQ